MQQKSAGFREHGGEVYLSVEAAATVEAGVEAAD
jgi:hypothetical protein